MLQSADLRMSTEEKMSSGLPSIQSQRSANKQILAQSVRDDRLTDVTAPTE